MKLASLFFGLILMLSITVSVSADATVAPKLTANIDRIEYTDSQLSSFGFGKGDLKEYKRRLNSTEGAWWGHLSPMEMMMYSAKNEGERRRFAKMYLVTNNPKAQAERKSAKAMYEAAREIFAEDFISQITQPKLKRSIIFVDLDCTDCADEVLSVVSASIPKVDIYVTNLDQEDSIKQQLIDWASALKLPPQKVTLNDDNGIYLKSYGTALDRIKVIVQ